MFIGWEGVGLCSYLLIGFWFTKDSAASAGKKAFITNRVGDFGFLLGTGLLVYALGTVDIAAHRGGRRGRAPWPRARPRPRPCSCSSGPRASRPRSPSTPGCPDAMEGPTPVSALIHAATMVTAGVYMVARLHVLFAFSGHGPGRGRPDRRAARPSTRRPWASSRPTSSASWPTRPSPRSATCSSASASGPTPPAIFHLMTHAFFKGLLFLAAGQRHPRPVRGAGHAQDGRPARPHPADLPRLPGRGAGHRRHPAAWPGSSPRTRSWPRPSLRGTICVWALGLVGGGADRVLHVPPDLPDLLRRVALLRGDGASPPRIRRRSCSSRSRSWPGWRSSAATSACRISSAAGPGSAASWRRSTGVHEIHLGAGTEVLLMALSVGGRPGGDLRRARRLREGAGRAGPPIRRSGSAGSTGSSRASISSTSSTAGSSSAASSPSAGSRTGSTGASSTGWSTAPRAWPGGVSRLAIVVDEGAVDGAVNGIGRAHLSRLGRSAPAPDRPHLQLRPGRRAGRRPGRHARRGGVLEAMEGSAS
ncbi:MAG: hypothetical protein MZV64_18110 [Ignavibacteriales bacterium]|nr:hypothetical protein [Ignavibacteriales bacterium]